MASDGPKTSLKIPSELCYLNIARAFVEAVCQLGGCDRTATDAIILAVNEAISNVIRHAHHGRPEAEMEIECRLLPESVEVCIYDEGEPFDLAKVPHMDPAEIRVGGRGVFLMRALMDELTCDPRGNRGNALRMIKHCRRSPHREEKA